MKKILVLFLMLGCSIAISSPVKSMIGACETKLENASPIPLPDGIVAVEYIESDGNSYFAMPFQQEIDYKLSMDVFAPCKVNGGANWLFGGYRNATSKGTYVQFYGNATYTFCGMFSPDSSRIIFNNEQRTIVVLDSLYSNTLSCFGFSVQIKKPVPSYPESSPMYLLASRPTSLSKIGTKLYCVKYESGSHYLVLIPVRFLNENDEWEGAMYDLVSGELFLNQGSGDFIIGPDLED